MKKGGLALFLLISISWAPQPAPTAPKLILIIVIDQMRFDYLTRFADLYQGGIKKLVSEGAVFTNAKYRHAATETGPGHSTIASGRHPSNSGIVANDWWDPLLHKEMNCVDDPVQSAVGGKGRAASPANFIGFTLGDVMKQRNSATKVVGISFKDRAAVMLAGRRADAAYWFEDDGNFITSTYYMPAAPEWLTIFNAGRLPDTYYSQGWPLLEDRKLYEQYAGRDDQPGEGNNDRNPLLPKPFPVAPPAKRYYTEFRRTPFAEEVMLKFVMAAIKAHHLGDDETTDILGLSFSTTDYVGHDYGPNSQEAMDQLLRLDRTLDQLLKYVDHTVGLSNTVIILSADHGVPPLVEVLRQQGVDAHRADSKATIKKVTDALAKKYHGGEKFITKADFDTFVLYFDEEMIRRQGLSLREVEKTAARALMKTGLLKQVYTKTELAEQKPSNDPFMQLFRNAFFAPRSGNLMLLPRRYLIFRSRGSGHGTAYDYDRHVPIIFMGTGIKAGRYEDDCGPEDIAPTLAQMLGFDYPKEPDARLLMEMLR